MLLEEKSASGIPRHSPPDGGPVGSSSCAAGLEDSRSGHAGTVEHVGLDRAESPPPPFKKDHHITGSNLFVSGYHGFAQLGNEHIPALRAFEDFPVLYCEYHSVSVVNDDTLSIKLRVCLDRCPNPTRYRLAVRLQLTTPGAGRRPGYLRSFVAQETCTSDDCIVEVLVPGYKDIWDLDLPEYQVHFRYFPLDSETGYRNIFRKKSFLMEL